MVGGLGFIPASMPQHCLCRALAHKRAVSSLGVSVPSLSCAKLGERPCFEFELTLQFKTLSSRNLHVPCPSPRSLGSRERCKTEAALLG